MPAGSTAIFPLVFQVLPSTPAGTTITNTVSVTSVTADPNLANNSDTVTTPTASSADLSATATTAARFAIAGDDDHLHDHARQRRPQ